MSAAWTGATLAVALPPLVAHAPWWLAVCLAVGCQLQSMLNSALRHRQVMEAMRLKHPEKIIAAINAVPPSLSRHRQFGRLPPTRSATQTSPTRIRRSA